MFEEFSMNESMNKGWFTHRDISWKGKGIRRRREMVYQGELLYERDEERWIQLKEIKDHMSSIE